LPRVLDLDREEVGPRDALVASTSECVRSCRSRLDEPGFGRLRGEARLVAFTSTTKRWWRPRQIVSRRLTFHLERDRAALDLGDRHLECHLLAEQRGREVVDLDPGADRVFARIEVREQQGRARHLEVAH